MKRRAGVSCTLLWRAATSRLASDYSESELTRLTAGISCVDINVLVQSAFESGHRLDAGAHARVEERTD